MGKYGKKAIFKKNDVFLMVKAARTVSAVIVTNSFSFPYCMIRHNQHLEGLACTACTGVSSRTGPLYYLL